jgi:hypothetical protein
MRPYICFYRGKRVEVQAVTSYQAQLLAVAAFKLRPNQRYEVTVMLADVTHTAVN